MHLIQGIFFSPIGKIFQGKAVYLHTLLTKQFRTKWEEHLNLEKPANSSVGLQWQKHLLV